MSVSINAICRKDRINQNRTTNIYLRFTVNRRSRYVSTGINIPADDWDFNTQTLKRRILPFSYGFTSKSRNTTSASNGLKRWRSP